MSPDSPDSTLTRNRPGRPTEVIQMVTVVVAATFLLVGVLGFIPGVTTGFDEMEFAGHRSEAHLFGVFQVSVLHNLVHLLFGVVGLVMARSVRGAKTYLIAGGVIYLLLWLYGLLVAEDSAANIVPLNAADDWLHLALGVGMLGLGLLLGRRRREITLDPSGRATYT